MPKQDNKNYFMVFIRKYKTVVIILILIPIILCFACYFSVPFFNKAGGPSWLSFWGGYLGSTIMAGITLYVLERQLKQNQEENAHNRDNNIAENVSNRQQSEKLRTQELELKWFNDLKLVCTKLFSAFNSNEIIVVSDLNPLSIEFNDKVAQLLTRMNEAYFGFQLVVNYHNGVSRGNEITKIEHFVHEYLALLSDMNSLHVYVFILKKGLANADLTKEELDAKLKGFILNHKRSMEFPKISENRVWDLLIDDRFDKIEYISEVLNNLRKRIDNFPMKEVGTCITELIKSEYKKIKEYNAK